MGRKKKKTKTTTKTTTSSPSWATNQKKQLASQIGNLGRSGDLAKTVGFTADQQQAHDMTRGLTGAAGQIGQDAANAQQAAATGTGLFGKQSFDPTSVNMQQYAAQAGNLLAGQLGQIGAGADARGTSGGARAQKAAQAAQQEAAANLAAKQADITLQDEQQLRQLDQADLAARRQAQQGSVGQAAAAQNALYKPAQELGKIGAEQQQLQQKQADDTFTNLQRQAQLLNQATQGESESTTENVTKLAGGTSRVGRK